MLISKSTFLSRASMHLLVVLSMLMISSLSTSARAQAPAPPGAPPPAADAAAQPASPPAQAAPPPVYAPPPAGYVTQQPLYGQPYAYAPQPPPPRRPRLRKGLMISGIAVFGASYIIAAVTGAALLDVKRNTCSDCRDVGGMLLIPLAGPFLAIPQANSGDGGLVVLGIVQLAGAGLLIGGVIQFVHSKRQAEQSGYYSLDLPKGRRLSFDVQASPARVGPSLQLRF